MKYVRQLRMPANLSHKDLIKRKSSKTCEISNCDLRGPCDFCMLYSRNKVYFDHWFKNQYKGERLKKGKMSIMLEGKKL